MTFEKLQEFFDNLTETNISVSTNSAGAKIIPPTKRNEIGRDVNNIFYDILTDAGFLTYKTADGIIIAVPNDSIADDEEICGDISFSIKISVKGLDYDPEIEAEAYAEDREKALQKKLAAAEKKKIAFERAQLNRQLREQKSGK